MRILYNLFGLINCFEQITCNTFPGYKNTVNENFAGVSHFMNSPLIGNDETCGPFVYLFSRYLDCVYLYVCGDGI